MRICHPHMVGWRLAALNEAVVALATEYREFHRLGPRRRLGGSEKGHEISFLRANSLRILTGNFLPALQGIKSGDQGSFRRDQGIPPSSAIWRSPLVTNPIIGAVGRVAPARVQRAHRRGDRGFESSPPAARPL